MTGHKNGERKREKSKSKEESKKDMDDVATIVARRLGITTREERERERNASHTDLFAGFIGLLALEEKTKARRKKSGEKRREQEQ